MAKYHDMHEALKELGQVATNLAYHAAYRVKRNPVLVGTAALWALDTLNTGDPLTWRGLVVAAVGFLVRSKVVPAHEVIDLTEQTTGFIHDVLTEAASDTKED